MITKLDVKCCVKGHGRLSMLEVDGLFYTYCKKCVAEKPQTRSYYEFCGINKASSLRAYCEMEGCKKCNWHK